MQSWSKPFSYWPEKIDFKTSVAPVLKNFEFFNPQHAYVENLETSNIQYTTETGSFLFSVQSLVTTMYKMLEQTIVHVLSHSAQSVTTLDYIHTLGDKLVTSFDFGFANVMVEPFTSNSQQFSAIYTSLYKNVCYN